jgi:hypothetical protein
MLRVRPTWVVLTCALFLNAAPVSIFNDVTNEVLYANSVVGDATCGASFSTGGTAYNLTSVVLELSNDAGEPPDTVRASRPIHGMRGRHASARPSKAPKAKPSKAHPAGDPAPSITVALWSDNGSPFPGTLLATSATTLLDTSLGDSPAPFSFPFASYPLTANTRYWIVVTSPGDNSVGVWWGTPDVSGPDVASEYYIEDDDTVATPNAPPGEPEFDGAFLMQVIGDPSTPPPTTPAPASVTLVLIGLGCAALYFRRRKILRSS